MDESKTFFVGRNRDLLVVAGLAVLVAAIYFPVAHFDFINLDDNLYVYENSVILRGLNWDTVKFAFTVFYSANWHPLTWLSHALDVQMFGAVPGPIHVVNVVFHLLNSVLAFVVFRRFTGRVWKSAVIAALFAVHPVHVESVAWIAERKDVLSTAFWLLTMWAYARYAEGEKPASLFARLTSTPYLLVLALFACGLMAKPMLVTLPCVLLLLDIWPLERWKKLSDLPMLAAEKVPMFVLAAVSSVLTFLAQKNEGAVESLNVIPLNFRLMNAVVSYVKYIGMAFYPRDLAVLYPMPPEISAVTLIGSLALLAAITAVCVWQFRSRKYLLVGWLWFVGTLVPVIGIVQVGSQSLADRYTYVPYFGLFIMAVFGVADIASHFAGNRRVIGVSASVAAIVIFCVLSAIQIGYWRDNETLYTHALAVTRNNFLISHNLCHALTIKDKLDDAEPLCRQAIDINPSDPYAYNTLGIIDFKRGEFSEAETNFKRSLDHGSRYPLTLVNLGLAKVLQGRPDEGEIDLKRAADFTSGSVPPQFFANAVSSLANAYAAKENYTKAAENYNRLVFIEPNNIDARVKLADSLYRLNRYDDAQAQAENVLKAEPNSAEMLNVYGLVLLEKGRIADARQAFEKALKIKPELPGAADNLAKAKART
ncbi:MAG: tetratricopeptide repeat protein [Acidobacteriota bacterium]